MTATATISISQADVFFPKHAATLTKLKDGETTRVSVGADIHTITRKGDILEMIK
jgi:hypothetical protein